MCDLSNILPPPQFYILIGIVATLAAIVHATKHVSNATKRRALLSLFVLFSVVWGALVFHSYLVWVEHWKDMNRITMMLSWHYVSVLALFFPMFVIFNSPRREDFDFSKLSIDENPQSA